MNQASRQLLLAARKRMAEAAGLDDPPVPKAVFKPKFKLPLLPDYSLPAFPDSYWARWKKKTLEMSLPVES